MSNTDGYNGWTNRATWAVALHVNNDQGWQEEIHELVKQLREERLDTLDEDVTEIPEDEVEGYVFDVAEAVKDNVTVIVDPLAYVEEFGDVSLSTWANGPGIAARDIGDLKEVNWHELAESFIRDVREGDGWEASAAPVPVATLVRDGLPNATGHQALYRLKPALSGHEYVVVSATSVPGGGPETYIFPADANGAVTDWLGMDGSYKGGLSHAKALEGAGYAIEG